MANYTLADIKALRDKTGAGMMDVKNALSDADGDVAKAEELLRLKGLKTAAKREGRVAGAGLVLSHIANDGSQDVGVVLEVNSETDFVAKNEKFIAFAQEILDAAVAANAQTVEDVLAAPHADGTVADRVANFTGIIGEKLAVGSFNVLKGDHVEAYMHRTSPDIPPQVAVLVATDAAGESVAHDVAVHIAAFSPAYLTQEDVPEEVVENERRVVTELTRQEGKPEAALPKIVEGRLGAFYKQIVLVDQPFARDPKQTVGQIVKASGGNVTGFVRVRVGESASEEAAQ